MKLQDAEQEKRAMRLRKLDSHIACARGAVYYQDKWSAALNTQGNLINEKEELRKEVRTLRHERKHYLEIATRALRGSYMSMEATAAILDEHHVVS